MIALCLAAPCRPVLRCKEGLKLQRCSWLPRQLRSGLWCSKHWGFAEQLLVALKYLVQQMAFQIIMVVDMHVGGGGIMVDVFD